MSEISIDFKAPHQRALQKIENALVKKYHSNVPPPNAPSTIAQKGSSKTLIDTGEMIGHVTHRQTEEGGQIIGEVGIFEEEIAKRASILEHGVPWENRPGKGRRKRAEYFGVEPTETSSIEESRAWFIPPRPVLRPVVDEVIPKVQDEMAEEIWKQIERQLGW